MHRKIGQLSNPNWALVYITDFLCERTGRMRNVTLWFSYLKVFSFSRLPIDFLLRVNISKKDEISNNFSIFVSTLPYVQLLWSMAIANIKWTHK